MPPEEAKPAGARGGHRESSVTNWKAHEKNTLQAFLTLTLPSGMALQNCTFHQKDRARWIGLPARQSLRADGSPAYSPVVESATTHIGRQFQIAALAPVDQFLEGREG